jgi:hypothetical protein
LAAQTPAEALSNGLPGRGTGEIPLNQAAGLMGYTFDQMAKVTIAGGLLRAADRNCGADAYNMACGTAYYTSVENDSSVQALCGDLGASTLYVLAISTDGSDSELYIADTCNNSADQTKPNRRAFIVYSNFGKPAVANVEDPISKASVQLTVVHPSIFAQPLGGSVTWSLLPPTGYSIYGAGVLKAQNGQLTYIDNCSGHFKPDQNDLDYTLVTLIKMGLKPAGNCDWMLAPGANCTAYQLSAPIPIDNADGEDP